MRKHVGLVLAATLGVGGGCLQIVGWEEPRLDHGAGGSGGGTGIGGAAPCKEGDVEDCYDGPMGTAGKGICRGGKHTCKGDGTWGECNGEVLPQAEDCSTAADENCDGYQCGDTVWALKIDHSDGRGVAVDKKTGDIYLAGTFSEVVMIGGDTFIPIGNGDFFLFKFDASGKYLWGEQLTGGIVKDLATDSAGDVVVLLGMDVNAGSEIRKYDKSGKYIWGRDCGASAKIVKIAIDPKDDVVLGGSFSGTIDCGSGSLTSAGAEDVLVAKVSASGSGVWSRRFGDVASQQARSVAVDPVGGVFAVGDFTGVVDFSGHKLSDGGGGSGFFLKLAPDGSVVSAQQDGGLSMMSAGLYQISVNALAQPVVTGHFSGAFTFCNGPEMPVGENYVEMLGLNGSGCLWSRKLGLFSGYYSHIFDSSGNVIFLAAVDNGTADFGGGPIMSDGLPHVTVAKVSKTGAFMWGKRFADGHSADPRSMAVGPSDEVIVTGDFYKKLDLGTVSLTEDGGGAAFLARLAP